MPDAEVGRAAAYLATHLLLLLGVGILCAILSILVIVWAARVAGRYRPLVQRGLSTLAHRIHESDIGRRVVPRVTRLAPSAYLALHLTLGFVLAVAIAIFTALAEEALEAHLGTPILPLGVDRKLD